MLNPNFVTQRVEDTQTYGKFILEPLPLSFGHSIGHSLRRTMLSSLKGSAITNIKIDGSNHLFSTIKGVKESAMEIALNLKQLRFETSSNGPFKVYLSVKKPSKVYGKDLEGEVKVINNDLYICEVTDNKGKVDIEAIVETGYGYYPVEEREARETGFVPVDAFFSPVKKVVFKVEEARVGRKSNLERLIIEVWTDGSVQPKDAIKQASTLLGEYYTYILSGKDNPEQKAEKTEAEVQKESIDKKLFEVIIDELNLPSRVINALLRENIETVADLVKAGKGKLTNMKGVGKKSIELIDEELKKMGIELQ